MRMETISAAAFSLISIFSRVESSDAIISTLRVVYIAEMRGNPPTFSGRQKWS